MDVETRLQLVREVAEEIVTEEELRHLLETEEHPLAYDGFEPSGLAHLPFGIYRPFTLKKLLRAGFRFKLLLADWFAWINNKLGGDLERIRRAGEYFVEVWKAAGVPMDQVEILWSSDLVRDPEYWKLVLSVAKHHNLRRTLRALDIAGREGSLENPTAWIFYPCMQVADIFYLGVQVCQLGMDQRRANMLAREVAPKLGRRKPIAVHHHMLMSLRGKTPEEKMSKSKPETCIFVHDSREEIERKLRKAYCPERDPSNPVVDYVKHLVFPAFGELRLELKSGEEVSFGSFAEFEKQYVAGKIHPLDLKQGLVEYLDRLVSPIREHFKSPQGMAYLSVLEA
ncbi:MAG: tyrosine--tRNA ligase [Candidatus Hadarchaeales archaeon]